MTRVPESTALVALRRELHAHIHARIGEAAFGTTPGEAELMATLRSDREEVLDRLREESVHRAQRVSESNGLELTHSWTESFPVTFNHPEAVAPAGTALSESSTTPARARTSGNYWTAERVASQFSSR